MATLVIGISSESKAQSRLDTWFRADKAVNAQPGVSDEFYEPEPGVPGTFGNPGGDGTSVDTWYDIIDFESQDAIPHPADPAYYPNAWNHPTNPGFAYPVGSGNLDPQGSVPNVPTFRRNSVDNLNFNPVVQFDGSGVGQALHFRARAEESIAVFIVFKAVGAGNTAETQRLLFGGDVDTHHNTAFNFQNWAGNLSLGVSTDGLGSSLFSVGRTWYNGSNQTYFESGGIDILGAPTIGCFTRIVSTDREDLNTYVNGIDDVDVTRDGNPFYDNPLFPYNRLGKHFNSNNADYNLTGNIAEVLLIDVDPSQTSFSTTMRQRIESYLAV